VIGLPSLSQLDRSSGSTRIWLAAAPGGMDFGQPRSVFRVPKRAGRMSRREATTMIRSQDFYYHPDELFNVVAITAGQNNTSVPGQGAMFALGAVVERWSGCSPPEPPAAKMCRRPERRSPPHAPSSPRSYRRKPSS
jgi:hypothetical protein